MDDIILVDLNDRELGSCEKMTAHVSGQLHRAFSLFIIHEGKMLLQQRAIEKCHSGGLWTNACCSHPRFGEDLASAVRRRVLEELGGNVGAFDELFSFVYRVDFGNVIEYEYDHVFLSESNLSGLDPDPLDVMSVCWVSLEELLMDLRENPDRYSTWFITAAPKVIQLFRERREKDSV